MWDTVDANVEIRKESCLLRRAMLVLCISHRDPREEHTVLWHIAKVSTSYKTFILQRRGPRLGMRFAPFRKGSQCESV
ncbi:hypothetical protein NU195Hw_g2562t1 [Hortaea werneckii]